MKLIALKIVDSTNTEIKRRWAAEPEKPFAVVAETQSAGRGRNGRTWNSAAGGLWLSIGWAGQPGIEYAPLPLIVALSVCRTLWGAYAIAACIKWPNDVLVSGRKICGILVERDRELLILGVGLNANQPPEAIGTGLAQPATSILAESGTTTDLGELAAAVCSSVQGALDQFEAHGFAALRDEAISRLAWLGENIELTVDAERSAGIFEGIDEAGRMVLRESGGRRIVSSAESVRLVAAGR